MLIVSVSATYVVLPRPFNKIVCPCSPAFLARPVYEPARKAGEVYNIFHHG